MTDKPQNIEKLRLQATIIRVVGRSFEKEYCVDITFLSSVKRVFRRILFVYPKEYCTPREAIIGALSVEKAPEKILEMLKEACQEARTIKHSYKPSFTEFLERLLPLPPRRKEVIYSEARIASELCSTIFFDEDLEEIQLAGYTPAFIEYRVGDPSDAKWRRLIKIAKIDNMVMEKLSDILSQKSRL